MSLKTNPSLSIELGEDIGNNLFLLHGHKNLRSNIPYIEDLHEGLFSKHYDSGDSLLYEATFVCEGHDHLREVGLGVFKIEDDKHYIERQRCLYVIDEDNKLSDGDNLLSFHCDTKYDEKLIISSHAPVNSREALCHDNSVLHSKNSPHTLSCTTLNKNSLLGRLDDDIEAIDISSLFTPNNILKVVTQFTRMLKFMSSIIDVKRLRTPQIEFKPTKCPTAKEGVCYFDKEDKVLKYYNGTEWVNLS
tara:strand:- start:539 stop:1279 length:741 start_codon:yes stop_codon:yes gene_type:complete